MSTPTHQRGFIDPAVLVERARAHQRADVQSPLIEQLQSVLRLHTARNESTLVQARTLEATPFVLALRYALGDDVRPKGNAELFAAAARIRHPNADDERLLKVHGDAEPDGAHCARYQWQVTIHKSAPYVWRRLHVTSGFAPAKLAPAFAAIARHSPESAAKEPWYLRWRFGGEDPGVILYTATLLPSSLEHYFAEGADALGNNLDWSEARWETSAYLRPLLDPTVPMTPMATLLLGLTLAAKEPGQAALAVDALVLSWRESRLDIAALGQVMRDLLREPMVMASRYAKCLRAALRIEPRLSADLVDLLCITMQARPAEPPKDTAMLLELLQETMLNAKRALSDHARRVIGQMALGGKGAALRRNVLGASI